jgi:hypothetical protein
LFRIRRKATFVWGSRFMPQDGSSRICIPHYLGELLLKEVKGMLCGD